MTTDLNEVHRASNSRKARGGLAGRIASEGPHRLSDAELLTFLLNDGEAARKLDAFGSLRALLKADHRTARGAGISTTKFAIAQTALELSRRHQAEHLSGLPAARCPGPLREYVHSCMRDLPYEVFCVVWLDHRHRIMKFQELFRGTIDGARVYPREVVREALAVNAGAVILVHNHPSGDVEPSDADTRITARLKEALGLIDVRLLDHLIVGEQMVESFADRGLL